MFIRKIENSENFENPKISIFEGKNQTFRIFEIFDFSDENFENQNFVKIFSKIFFAEMKKYFWSRFFSTVWIMSLDFKKAVQSTRGSSSMPRQMDSVLKLSLKMTGNR